MQLPPPSSLFMFSPPSLLLWAWRHRICARRMPGQELSNLEVITGQGLGARKISRRVRFHCSRGGDREGRESSRGSACDVGVDLGRRYGTLSGLFANGIREGPRWAATEVAQTLPDGVHGVQKALFDRLHLDNHKAESQDKDICTMRFTRRTLPHGYNGDGTTRSSSQTPRNGRKFRRSETAL